MGKRSRYLSVIILLLLILFITGCSPVQANPENSTTGIHEPVFPDGIPTSLPQTGGTPNPYPYPYPDPKQVTTPVSAGSLEGIEATVTPYLQPCKDLKDRNIQVQSADQAAGSATLYCEIVNGGQGVILSADDASGQAYLGKFDPSVLVCLRGNIGLTFQTGANPPSSISSFVQGDFTCALITSPGVLSKR